MRRPLLIAVFNPYHLYYARTAYHARYVESHTLSGWAARHKALYEELRVVAP